MYGGAICFDGDGSVEGCSFTNCINNGYGGAIHAFNVYVTNCSFVGCSANSKGAAICFDGDGSVVNCSFMDCNAKEGAAIYAYGSNCSVSGCSFVDGYAWSDGGAIYS